MEPAGSRRRRRAITLWLAGALCGSAVLWVLVGFFECSFQIGGTPLQDTLLCTDDRPNLIGWWVIALPPLLVGTWFALARGPVALRVAAVTGFVLVLGALAVVVTPLGADPVLRQEPFEVPPTFTLELNPRGGADRARVCLPGGACRRARTDELSGQLSVELRGDPAPGRVALPLRVELCRLQVDCARRTYVVAVGRAPLE